MNEEIEKRILELEKELEELVTSARKQEPEESLSRSFDEYGKTDKSVDDQIQDILNKKSIRSVGTREQVWEGLAKKTAGGLTKDDLIMNSRGKIVSKKRSEMGKKNNYLKRK